MKALRATAALIVAGLMLTACGGGSDDDAGQSGGEVSGEVSMWIPPIGGSAEAAYWPDKVKEFTARYPKVKVNVEVVPWENRAERFTTAIVGRQTPDVAYFIPDELAGYADQKLLADVSEVIADDKADFQPAALQAMTLDKTLYGVPTLMTVTTTLFNKKVVDALKLDPLPQTWDEVKAAAPRIKESGYYVTQYEAAPTSTLNGTFYPLLWQAGGEILNAEGTKAAINGPQGVQALDFAVWLATNGYTPKDGLTTALPVQTSPLAQGKVAMMISRSLGAARQAGLKDADIVVAPPLKGAKSVSYGTTGGYSIFKASKNQAAAKAWIDWLTSAEQLKKFLPPRNSLSPRISVTGLYPADSLEAQFEKHLPAMNPGLVHPQSRKIMDLIKPHLQEALLGKISSQQALNEAAADVDGLLSRG